MKLNVFFQSYLNFIQFLHFKKIPATLILEEQSIEALVNFIKTNFIKESHNSQQMGTQVIPPLYRTTQDHTLTSIK